MAQCQCLMKCILCGEKIPFSSNNCQCPLGEHLITNHPDVQMTHYAAVAAEESKKEDNKECKCKCNKRKKIKRSPTNKTSLYKTTVETWLSGPVKIKCPKCGSNESPCIRKQRNKVAYSKLGALILLGCWPLCFLPFLSNNGSIIQLFCKSCGKFLGTYNRKSGKLVPPNANDKDAPQDIKC